MVIGCTHTLRLSRRYLLHIVVCKTSVLKLSVSLEFFYLCNVQRVMKTHWDSRRLDRTALGRCEHPLTLGSNWTGLDSTRLDSTRLDSNRLDSTRLDSTRLDSTRHCSPRLDSHMTSWQWQPVPKRVAVSIIVMNRISLCALFGAPTDCDNTHGEHYITLHNIT